MHQPPPPALDWIERHLGEPVRHAEPMVGAWSARVFRVSGDRRAAVLRLFTNREWLELEPDLAPHEAAALELVAGAGLPTPRLLAVDPDGTAAGHPAILMSLLPGRLDLGDRNVERLAEPLVRLAEFDPGPFPWSYRRWTDPLNVPVPAWVEDKEAAHAAFASVRDLPLDIPGRLIHRDYHPTNVLWIDGDISGIVDWVNACLGPTEVDVGHCRLDLTVVNGTRPASRFLEAWERLSGRRYDRGWDLVAASDLMADVQVYPPWIDLGVTHLDLAEVRRRVEAFVVDAWREVR